MQRSAEIENWSSNIYRLALSNIVSPEDEYEFFNSMWRATGAAREVLKMSCASVIIAWYFAK